MWCLIDIGGGRGSDTCMQRGMTQMLPLLQDTLEMHARVHACITKRSIKNVTGGELEEGTLQ